MDDIVEQRKEELVNQLWEARVKAANCADLIREVQGIDDSARLIQSVTHQLNYLRAKIAVLEHDLQKLTNNETA